MTRAVTRRCAVYTRKSSDEGLDQAFNSLDAQREAGEAFVKSQASEGWRLLPARYDDGGYSGGSMDRPALERLLAAVDAGEVDVVVVYKIDRLTRSLADFARIVEQFDARGVSFISVTQPFNTTSSMGRLTLNVLLSFAQFEREVTGEWIRDKIAASKAKGMWMGGTPPLGYDLPVAGSRMLRVNPVEGATVQQIFARYLAIGSVHRLAADLARSGVVSKRHLTATGRVMGGVAFSRGALFHLLRNRTYLGKITHKGAVHEGSHDAILDQDLFDAVQARLDGNVRHHRARGERRVEHAPLTGRLFDAEGEAMSPAFSRGRGGRLYRYYVSSSLQQGAQDDHAIVRRVPAPAIEKLVVDALARVLPTTPAPIQQIKAVHCRRRGIEMILPAKLQSQIRDRLAKGESVHAGEAGTCALFIPVALPLRGGRRTIEAGATQAAPDPVLVAALRRAHTMISRDPAGMPIAKQVPTSPYDRRILRLAFLSPAIQSDILVGKQPRAINLEALMRTEIPLAWADQRIALGWSD